MTDYEKNIRESIARIDAKKERDAEWLAKIEEMRNSLPIKHLPSAIVALNQLEAWAKGK